jgi:hypothetical protein
MSKLDIITHLRILDVVRITDETLNMIWSKRDIDTIVDRILSHDLLTERINLISLSIKIVSIVYLAKMMIVHAKFQKDYFVD